MNYNHSKKSSKYYFIIGVIGLTLSIVWCSTVNPKLFSDFEYYYNLAVGISQGKPWGDTYTSVGYPIILGFIFKIFGASTLVAKVFNIILTVMNYYLVYSILEKIDIEEKSKKLIYTLFVIFPLNIFYNNLVATEILFTNIFLLVTNVYLSNFRHKYIIIGILTAVNTMVKPFFIVYFFAIFIVDIIKYKDFKNSIKGSLTVLFISILCLSPWFYRNTKLTGELTFVSNNGGIVLYINNNSQNNIGRWMAAEDVENSIVKTEEYKSANMTKKNMMLKTAAKEWIKEHPKDFIKLGFLRLKNTYFNAGDFFYTTYGSDISETYSSIIYNVANVFKIAIFYSAIVFTLIYSLYILICIFTNRFEYIDSFALYSLVIFYMFSCVYFITEGQQRYSFPLIFTTIYCFNHLLNMLKEKIKGLF
ncbi:glycosyltransferase family 39 protein [Clostridium liquoris]|jgi:hypothetical protein|nr:glycosyltransferase family 39 protein [Clostridium liquoris]